MPDGQSPGKSNNGADAGVNFIEDAANLVMDSAYMGCNAFSLVSCLLEC